MKSFLTFIKEKKQLVNTGLIKVPKRLEDELKDIATKKFLSQYIYRVELFNKDEVKDILCRRM